MDGKTGLWVAAGIAAIAGGWFALSQKSAAAKAEKAAADNAQAVQAVGDAVKAAKAAQEALADKFHAALSTWGRLSDSGGLQKLIESLPTKRHFAAVAAVYRQKYGKQLLDAIKEDSFMSQSEFKKYNAMIAKKPA